MFENVTVHKTGEWDDADAEGQAHEKAETHALDSEEMADLHKDLLAMYQQELDRQYENRMQMATDADFYDHIQWDEADANELAERGQAAIVYNVTAQTCNWIMGSEKRGRSDFKVLPRRKADGVSAERKTQLLKYLTDVNKTVFHRSRAFEDTVKVGIGWLEDGVQDSDDGEPVYSRYESWRNILWDSSATEMDLGDARYLFRVKWVDEDIALALAPDRADLIKLSIEDGTRYGIDQHSDEAMDSQEIDLSTVGRATNFSQRRRLRLTECWVRKPSRVKRITQGDMRGEIYDERNPHPAVRELVESHETEDGNPILAEKVMMRMHCAIMTTGGMLYFGPSPYRHNKFPFTPVWGYRRDRDGLPYGVIRGLRDIQEDINKRASKAQYILATNKVIMDEGAVDDIELLREEIARPDGIIVKRQGKELVTNADRDLSQWQLELMSRNISMIQQVGGVTDEQMGRTTNATSGRAIEARQEQGSLVTSKLFDNLRYAFNEQGCKQLSMIEQFFTEEKQFRITNQRGTPEFVTINDGLPENDIVRQKADFIITDGEWRASLRQAQADQMMEMISRMNPQVALVLLDLVVELMDLPNRDEMVNRIRQMNGMSDPAADPDSPEEQQRKQAQAQQQAIQQQAMQLDMETKAAAVRNKDADTQVKIAKAARENMATQGDAIDTAVVAVTNALAVPVADGLLHEGGFSSRTEKEQLAAAQQQAAQQQAAQEQAMQQQQAGLPPEQQ